MKHFQGFVLSFLFFVLLVSASLPQAQAFTGASGEFGNWSWDGTNKILTVVANATANAGDTEAHAYNFQDIVNAIDYYGWSALYNRSNSGVQFEFSFRIVIGDGSTTTWFKDDSKQIVFTTTSVTGSYQLHIEVKNHANLVLGLLISSTEKTTYGGVTVRSLVNAYIGMIISGNDGAVIYLYACSFVAEVDAMGLISFVNDNSRIWGCIFDRAYLYFYDGSTGNDIYHTTIYKGTYGIQFYKSVSGTFNDVFLYSQSNAIYFSQAGGIELKNIKIRSSVYPSIAVYSIPSDNNLTDADLDSWTFDWTGSSGASRIYRKYSFDLRATYPNGTNLQNANVTIYNKLGKIGSWLTFANGSIPTQTLTQGFYNQTGGNTIYSYNPYNITATFGDYTYYKSWTVQEQAKWEIALLPIATPVNQSNLMLIGSLLSIPIMLAFALAYRKKHKP